LSLPLYFARERLVTSCLVGLLMFVSRPLNATNLRGPGQEVLELA